MDDLIVDDPAYCEGCDFLSLPPTNDTCESCKEGSQYNETYTKFHRESVLMFLEDFVMKLKELREDNRQQYVSMRYSIDRYIEEILILYGIWNKEKEE